MTPKKEILAAWYHEVWVLGQTSAIPKFMNANSQAKGILPDMSVNADEFSVLVDTMRQVIHKFEVEIPIALDQGNWLAAVVEVKASSVKTGAKVYATGHVMARFEEDKMVEVYNSFDFLTLFEQLGQLPESTLALLMSGTDFN